MTSYFRTANALGILLGINLIVRFINLNISENLILSNHLVEAAAVFAVISFLVDLNILNTDIQRNYIKIGLITFFSGIFIVAASFSSLFVLDSFIEITVAWFKIAPQIITMAVIGLYMTDKLTYKPTLLGMPNTGKRGLLNVFIFSALYSMLVISLLNKYGWLVLW